MKPPRMGCVVEGSGEERALRILIVRTAQRLDPGWYVDVQHPVKIKRSRLEERFGELQKGVDYALRSIKGAGAVLILLDSDGDCPANLARRCTNGFKVNWAIFLMAWCWLIANMKAGSWRQRNP